MKKIFISLFAIISSVSFSYAGSVAGTGGSTEITQIANNILLGAQQAIQQGTQASTFVNTAANVSDMTKTVIADPIANYMKTLTVSSLAKSTLNWAKGGFQGNPNFVVNPNVYFSNVMTSAIKSGLGQINNPINKNIFTNSVIGSVVKNYRNTQSSPSAPYTLGTAVQNDMCSDSNLSATALNDVANSLNIPQNSVFTSPTGLSQYNSRKVALYNSYCVGNASKDAALQKQLADRYFSNGGFSWAGWEQQTQHPELNTEYGNVTKTSENILSNASNQQTIAQNEVTQSGGYVGVKNCAHYSSVIDTSTGDPICDEWETKTPAKLVADSVSKASFGSLDTLINSHGAGDALTAFVSLSLDDLINNGISSASQSISNSGLNSNTMDSLSGYVNTADGSLTNTSITTSNQTNSIVNAADKAKLVGPMITQLNREADEIAKLKTINNIYYLNNITSYENSINSLDSCYNTLTTNYASYLDWSMNSNISSGRSYISTARAAISTNRAKLLADLNNLNIADKLTQDTLSTINSSNDSVVISDAYSKYQDALNAGIVPYIGTSVTRQVEYQQIQNQANKDITDNLNPKTAQCNQMISTAQWTQQQATLGW